MNAVIPAPVSPADHNSCIWRVEIDRKQSRLRIIDRSEASMSDPWGPIVLANLSPHMDEPIAKANLMAAAPELLESLEGVLKWWTKSEEGDDMPLELWDNAQFAIEAAKGGYQLEERGAK